MNLRVKCSARALAYAANEQPKHIVTKKTWPSQVVSMKQLSCL